MQYTQKQAEAYFVCAYAPYRTPVVYIPSDYYPGDYPGRWMDTHTGEVVDAVEQHTTESAPVGFPILVKIENAQAIWEIKQ